MEADQQDEKTMGWKTELKTILLFSGKLLLIYSLIALGIIIYPIIFKQEPLPDQILVRFLNVTGGISIIASLVILFLLLNPFQQSQVVTTAGRFRAPNQRSYSNDIIKRQVNDWSKSIGTALVLFLGFFLSTI